MSLFSVLQIVILMKRDDIIVTLYHGFSRNQEYKIRFIPIEPFIDIKEKNEMIKYMTLHLS